MKPTGYKFLHVATTFAVAKQRTTCSAEPGHFASIRIGMAGRRQVALAPTALVIEFTKCSDQASVVNAGRAYEWLKTVTPEGLKAFRAYASDHKMIRHATVGVGDILYTQVGWCFFELIGSLDFVGVRAGRLFVLSLRPVSIGLNIYIYIYIYIYIHIYIHAYISCFPIT